SGSATGWTSPSWGRCGCGRTARPRWRSCSTPGGDVSGWPWGGSPDGSAALQHARLAPPWRPDDRLGLPPGTTAHGRGEGYSERRGALRSRRRPDPGARHVAERLPLPGPGFPRAVRPPGKSTGAEEKVTEGACNLRLGVDNG